MDDMPEFQDKLIECLDCGRDFLFEAGEAAFYWSKLLSEPKRCQKCRKFRKRSIVPANNERR